MPQFITEIDGLDIHFIHARSKHEGALPLIVTHGWPGSIIEQLKIIDPLTNPTAYGASASDAFHLVIPSMPGYGFSGRPTSTGWGPERMARAWAELMKRWAITITSPRAAIGAHSSSTKWVYRRPRDCSPSIPTCPPPSRLTSTRLSANARRLILDRRPDPKILNLLIFQSIDSLTKGLSCPNTRHSAKHRKSEWLGNFES